MASVRVCTKLPNGKVIIKTRRSYGAMAFVLGLDFPNYFGSGNANFSFSGGDIRNTFSVIEISA